jgi:molecular chaperone DnaJ
MAAIDYYRTLGVTRDASDEDIKKSYRKLVMQYHPDRNPGNAEAEAKIRELNEAYDVIGDPEKRRTFERLRWGDEVGREEPPDPAVILEAMEQKLFDEARKEVLTALVKDVKRIKAELALIRERVVAAQGYDSFKMDVILARGGEVLHEFMTPEMEVKKKRLLDVALHMMLSQKVAKRDDEKQVKDLKDRLTEAYQRGRLTGFAATLEMFYERR